MLSTSTLSNSRQTSILSSKKSVTRDEEHTWGTDGLAKLEAIKDKLDPQGLFQCQKCVGFKGPVRDQ